MVRALPVLTVATAVAVGVTGTAGGVAYAARQGDRNAAVTLPTGTVVDGVDVSGLDRAAAVAAVSTVANRTLSRPVQLTVDGHVYRTSAAALGATTDVSTAVDAAFARSTGGSWWSRSWDRVTGSVAAPTVDAASTGPVAARVSALAASIAQQNARPAADFHTVLAGGWLQVQPGHNGAALDPAAVRTALVASLTDGHARQLRTTVVAAGGQAAAAGTKILVRTGENRLYLYQGGRIVRTWPVATGSPDYPTPKGQYEVTLKRYLPTWHNPDPTAGWSKGMPLSIPPGPGNPLGTRALNLSASGIRIHGTPSWNSIGYSVSHGCIRMRMPDVEALFPLVSVGTPVFIVRAGGAHLPPAGAGISVSIRTEGG